MFKCPATCKLVMDRVNLPSLIAKNTSNAASVTGRNTEDKLKIKSRMKTEIKIKKMLLNERYYPF